MTFYSKIIGTGSYLPPRKVTNHELAEQLAAKGIETSDEWIVSRSGISARHYAEPNVTSSDMAVEAAKRALDAAGLQANDIDLIILATSTPDFFGGFPSTACVVQNKLGITNGAAAVDVQAVCSGFIYAMAMADSMIKSGSHKNALIIGAEVFSRILILKIAQPACCLVMVLERLLCSNRKSRVCLATKLHADGSHSDTSCVCLVSVNAGVIAGSAFLVYGWPSGV